MNKSESKYFNTAVLMDKAFLELLENKDFEYITVKEICEKAGVNRSTFYLHYDTIDDLLNESVEYMNQQFNAYFQNESRFNIEKIEMASKDDLYLITPQYLHPYLQYIKDNRKIFWTALTKSSVLGSQNKFSTLFQQIFEPIMDKYTVPQENRLYIISFYISGIMCIIKMWLENNCKEPIEQILNIIVECIKKPI